MNKHFILFFIFSLFIIFSCNKNVKPVIIEEHDPVVKIIEERDSIRIIHKNDSDKIQHQNKK